MVLTTYPRKGKMEETKKDPVDQTQQASGDETSKEKDFVKHESYLKVLNEKKAKQAEAEKLASELKEFKQEKMKRDGKQSELLTTYEKEIAELKGKLQNTNKNYAWSTVTGAIKSAAKLAGCTDSEKLIRLMSDEDLKDLSTQLDDSFQVPKETLGKLIEKNKKENHFLFKSTEKKTAKGNPATKMETGNIDLSKLSLAELKEMHKKTYK